MVIETILKNISYGYYPRGKCAFADREAYIQTAEFNRLSLSLKSLEIDPNFQVMYNIIKNKFKDHDLISEIEDRSLLEWQDRCLSFELDIVKQNSLVKICLNISLLLPYYTVYVLTNEIQLNPYKWLALPQRNKILENTEYEEHLEILSQIVEDTINYSKFPEYIANVIVPDINFGDIEMGKFTLYNAFFLNENKLNQ